MSEPALIISGPTAAGKSALALDLAERLNGEIVSCDSVLVYRGFNIGAAKPTDEERARITHHLIDICDPHEQFHAARFRDECLQSIAEIRARGKRPIIVGGTTLYLSALLSGLSQLPDRDEELRSELSLLTFEQRYALLQEKDPKYASQIHVHDTLRIIRALEIILKTGKSLAEAYKAGREGSDEFTAQVINLTLPHEKLKQRIEQRTKDMIAAGLIDEVRELQKRYDKSLPPFTTVGYAQATKFLEGMLSESELEAEIIIATNQLAKRQRTFWRNEPAKRGWKIIPGNSSTTDSPEVVHYSDQILSTRAKGIQRGFSALSWDLEMIIRRLGAQAELDSRVTVYTIVRRD